MTEERLVFDPNTSRSWGTLLADPRLDDEEFDIQWRVRDFIQSYGAIADPEAAAVVERLRARPFAEHLKDKHNQKTHGRKGGAGSGGPSLDFDTVEQADGALAPAYAGWHAGLSAAEGDAFGAYSSIGYQATNGRLRAGHDLTTEQKAQVEALDSAIGRSAAPEDISVYRGISADALPRPPWAMVGGEMTDNGYPSTSAARDVGAKFAGYAKDAGKAPLVLSITVPKGHPLAMVTGAAKRKNGENMKMDESEMLLPRGTKVRFTSFQPEDYTVWGEPAVFGTLYGEVVP